MPTAHVRTLRSLPAPIAIPTPIEAIIEVEPPHDRGPLQARMFALVMLAIVLGVLGYGGYSASRAVSDSFIAPLTLSPESDVVVSSKLKLDELYRERSQIAADLQNIETELRANEQLLQRLRDLKGTFQDSATWLNTVNSHKARVSVADLSALSAQNDIAKQMFEEQRKLATQTEENLAAGLVTRTDYEKEMQKLSDLRRGVLDSQRNVLQSQSNMYEIQLTDRSLNRRDGAPLAPPLLASHEQLVRVELEIVRLESETRVKATQREASLQRFGEVDRLAEQLRTRPLFRAVKRKLELAFVPYTQLNGVVPGAEVYSCAWGMFFCKAVGKIGEILEGEVNQPDPWGTPARGQYAILHLTDHDAVRAKTLRVRAGSAATPAQRRGASKQQRLASAR